LYRDEKSDTIQPLAANATKNCTVSGRSPMFGRLLTFLRDNVPGFHRLERLPGQLIGANPFGGDIRPTRVPILGMRSGRPTVPFPTPWNYDQPIRILETYFWGADAETGSGRHNRYLDFPGFSPVLVTRDPQIIRAITSETGDKEGQFDRDTCLPWALPVRPGKTRCCSPTVRFGEGRRSSLRLPSERRRFFSPRSFTGSPKRFATRSESVLKRFANGCK
jgi:hypothetical protein